MDWQSIASGQLKEIVFGLITLTAVFVVGFYCGAYNFRNGMRRAVLRKPDNSGALELAIQVAKDGVIEIILTNATLKRIRKGEPVKGMLQGSQKSMQLRVRKYDQRDSKDDSRN